MNNKNYICVRQHVKNICNLEIDQAMELNIKLEYFIFFLHRGTQGLFFCKITVGRSNIV